MIVWSGNDGVKKLMPVCSCTLLGLKIPFKVWSSNAEISKIINTAIKAKKIRRNLLLGSLYDIWTSMSNLDTFLQKSIIFFPPETKILQNYKGKKERASIIQSRRVHLQWVSKMQVTRNRSSELIQFYWLMYEKDLLVFCHTSRIQRAVTIGNRKDWACLQLHGHLSRQPMQCLSAMLDPKDQAFYCISGSL